MIHTFQTYRPTPAPAWSDLCRQCPGLAAFERSAQEAGEKRLSWWLDWLSARGAFRQLFSAPHFNTLAECEAARAVALHHLREVFSAAAREPTQTQRTPVLDPKGNLDAIHS
jgi:hypothetical protein